MARTSIILVAAVLLAAGTGSSPGPLVAAGDGTTHLHLYIHETLAGANATSALLAASPLGGNSTYGGLGCFDDELREGSDPASQLVGRAQGLVLQADLQTPRAFSTLTTLVFIDGDYSGSTLVVYGRVYFGTDGKAAAERAVVGGTGRFRRARGYTLLSKFGSPTPSTFVFELNLYVKTDM